MSQTDPLEHLRTLVPNSPEFEAERVRLIREAIDGAPEHLRKKLLAMQLQLDLVRESTTPEQFNQHLWFTISENLENLADQFQAITNAVIRAQPSGTEPLC